MFYSQMSNFIVVDICPKCKTKTQTEAPSDSKVKDCEKCKTPAKFIQRKTFQREINTRFLSSISNTKPLDQATSSLIVDKQGQIIERRASKKTSKLTGYSATKTDLVDKCTICYCEFELEDKIFKTSCSHKFHTNCLSIWLATKPTCPQCPWIKVAENDKQSVPCE